ncbi:MAG: S1/P1 nuclease [Bacteroidales bacterium]|nr:S1/P1 nuclease [Bacteroidales bacterium]
MKKKILTLALAVTTCASSAFGWGRFGHATIARIAENHLTETTRSAIDEIMHGEHITEYASYADDYKAVMFIDAGFDPTDGSKRLHNHPHTFESSMDFVPFRGINDNGRYVKNCIHFVEQYAEDLKDWKNLSDSLRWNELVMLVHFVGDMHCPEHIRYNPEEMSIGYYTVRYNGSEVRYHTIWDDMLLTTKYPWSFSDLAFLFDTGSEKEYSEIVKGGPYDWGADIARVSWPVHQVKEGTALGKNWTREMAPLAQSQIRNAGYRLAHLLNMTFDPKYARKYSRRNR